MKPSDFKKLLSRAEPEHLLTLNSTDFSLSFPSTKYSIQLNGISALYDFLHQQTTGWEKHLKDFPSITKNEELSTSILYFQNWKNNIAGHLESNTLINYLGTIKNSIQQTEKIFPFDRPEAFFLIKVSQSLPNSLSTAFQYFVAGFTPRELSRDNFIGYLMAYEFDTKASSDITTRKSAEKKSLESFKESVTNYHGEIEQLIVNQIANINNRVQNFESDINSSQLTKNGEFDTWLADVKTNFEGFNGESNKKIEDLESLYSDKLRLEEPAKYWEKRAKLMSERGWAFCWALIILTLLICSFLGLLLWKAPDNVFLSFTEGDKGRAVRWSILFVTFISLAAFSFRTLTKSMFSCFHLASDCNERFTLTYFYLSLKKDTTIEKEEKQLIMQSLFSRADTGLLREDSSPTMPGFIDKFIGK